MRTVPSEISVTLVLILGHVDILFYDVMVNSRLNLIKKLIFDKDKDGEWDELCLR